MFQVSNDDLGVFKMMMHVRDRHSIRLLANSPTAFERAEQAARSGGYVEGLSPKPRESPCGHGIIARAECLQFGRKDDER
jgi:hypothetical protein